MWDPLIEKFGRFGEDTNNFSKGRLKDSDGNPAPWAVTLMQLIRLIHTEHCREAAECSMCHPMFANGGASSFENDNLAKTAIALYECSFKHAEEEAVKSGKVSARSLDTLFGTTDIPSFNREMVSCFVE